MSSKFLVSFGFIIVALSLITVQVVESKPIDLLEELMSDKFLMKIFEYLVDDNDKKGGSRLSAGDECMLPPRKGNCRALLRRFR